MTKLTIHVKPGSSQNKIVKNSEDGSITVYLHAKPHGGEANHALLEILAKHFRVPKTSIRIVRGEHARTKIVEL